MQHHVTAIAALALFAGSGISNANAAELVGKIPFDFYVGDKKLPAGQYAVAQLANGSVVSLRNSNGKSNAFVIVNSILPTAQNSGAHKLVFRQAGRQFVLGQVWFGNSAARETMRSRSEKALMRETGTDVAIRIVEVPIIVE